MGTIPLRHCLSCPCSLSGSSQPACPYLVYLGDPQWGLRNVLLLFPCKPRSPSPCNPPRTIGVWAMGHSSGQGCGSPVPICPMQENVLQRVLQLPVVSSTCETLQRKYSSTKESHPLMASVCEVYERGVQGAGALAMWGMEPVVRRLEPQCECVLGGRGRGDQQSLPWWDSAGTSMCLAQPRCFSYCAFAQGSRCGQQPGLPGLGPPRGEDPCSPVPCGQGKSQAGQSGTPQPL